MIALHIRHKTYNDNDSLLYIVNSEFIPRENDLITIDDALDGPDGSISTGSTVVKVEHVYFMNATRAGDNKLAYVNIYI